MTFCGACGSWFSCHCVVCVFFCFGRWLCCCLLLCVGMGVGGEFCLIQFAIGLIFQMRFCDNDSVEHSHVTARTKLRGPRHLRSLIICLSLTTRKLTT